MKTKADPRHQKRIHQMKSLFSWGFQENAVADESILEITEKVKSIDEQISKAASERPIDQINKIDLSILRLSTYELLLKNKTPFRVIVDEAVELAKEYGSDNSPSFINGVLGKIIERNKLSK
jgi:transcription antitermination protein NusB